jgi:hypothetical protein
LSCLDDPARWNQNLISAMYGYTDRSSACAHVIDCSFYSAPVSAHVRNTRVADRGLPTANLTDGLGSTALLMLRRRSVSRVHSKIHRSAQVSAYAYKQRL